MREFRERKGSLIDSQEQVGGYPRPAPTHHKLDVPDNHVDQWLAALAAKLERPR